MGRAARQSRTKHPSKDIAQRNMECIRVSASAREANGIHWLKPIAYNWIFTWIECYTQAKAYSIPRHTNYKHCGCCIRLIKIGGKWFDYEICVECIILWLSNSFLCETLASVMFTSSHFRPLDRLNDAHTHTPAAIRRTNVNVAEVSIESNIIRDGLPKMQCEGNGRKLPWRKRDTLCTRHIYTKY